MNALAVLLLVIALGCARDPLVPPPRPTITPASVRLSVGESVQLRATNATGAIVWRSSDGSVASVRFGKVTARAPGMATIRAIAGGASATAAVTVER